MYCVCMVGFNECSPSYIKLENMYNTMTEYSSMSIVNVYLVVNIWPITCTMNGSSECILEASDNKIPHNSYKIKIIMPIQLTF